MVNYWIASTTHNRNARIENVSFDFQFDLSSPVPNHVHFTLQRSQFDRSFAGAPNSGCNNEIFGTNEIFRLPAVESWNYLQREFYLSSCHYGFRNTCQTHCTDCASVPFECRCAQYSRLAAEATKFCRRGARRSERIKRAQVHSDGEGAFTIMAGATTKWNFCDKN